jgi:RHS repeat-associated protein
MPETGTPIVNVDYHYDAAGKPSTENYGNDTFAEYGYDQYTLQLTSLKHYKSGTPNALLRGTVYERDLVGSPTNIQTVWDGDSSTTTCGYDDINRLTSAIYPGPTNVTFGYDWVGNRTGVDWGAVNEVDKLPSSPSGSYVYDTVYGNLTAYDDNTTFEYDNYNLLKKINWPGSYGATQFLSDAAGNRLRMTTTGDWDNVYTFVYDTTAGIPAVLAEVVSGATKLYVRTPDGRLIAQAHIASGDAVLDHYYHFDALGSTKALTDDDGDVTDTYDYDVWGNVTHTYGSTQQPYTFVGQLGYYTHYQDPMLDPFSSSSGKYVLLQLGVRYYAPEIGRFTQRDALLLASSQYTYSKDTPLARVDPSGYFDARKLWIVGPIIDAATEGQFCISSTCYNNIHVQNNPLKSIRSLSDARTTAPITVSPPAMSCHQRRTFYPQDCYPVDAVDIPAGLRVDFDGLPQRPDPKDHVLKIPNLASCTMTCDADNPSSTPRLSCTNPNPKDHPIKWLY